MIMQRREPRRQQRTLTRNHILYRTVHRGCKSEITFIEDLITQGADAILISTADSTAIIPTINKAVDAGVDIFTFDIDAPDSQRLFCITAGEPEESGTAIGERAWLSRLERKDKWRYSRVDLDQRL